MPPSQTYYKENVIEILTNVRYLFNINFLAVYRDLLHIKLTTSLNIKINDRSAGNPAKKNAKLKNMHQGSLFRVHIKEILEFMQSCICDRELDTRSGRELCPVTFLTQKIRALNMKANALTNLKPFQSTIQLNYGVIL